MRIFDRMKRQIEEKLIKSWAKKIGGVSKAVRVLMDATEIAPSTAEKLVCGKYPSEPQFLIRKVLCDLTGYSEDELFPFAATKGKSRAS